jgi:glycosyltransferase involved in cell wall biosynthesis
MDPIMNQPIVSIIIPCFNDGIYLKEAVNSALAMDYQSLEIIILDDGSTNPETLDVLADIQQSLPEIRLLKQSENHGLAAARNAAITESNGEFILPLDADNRLRPQFARLAVDIFKQNENVGVVYGNAQFFGARSDAWEQPDFNRLDMLDFNQLDACACYRKSVWESAGGYEEVLFRQSWEDWDFWLSVCENNWDFHHLHEIVFEFRSRDDSLSSQTANPDIRHQLYQAIFERHRALFESAFFDLLHLKAERDWGMRDQHKYVQQLRNELSEALTLQREIRWFLVLRKVVKRLIPGRSRQIRSST